MAAVECRQYVAGGESEDYGLRIYATSGSLVINYRYLAHTMNIARLRGIRLQHENGG